MTVAIKGTNRSTLLGIFKCQLYCWTPQNWFFIHFRIFWMLCMHVSPSCVSFSLCVRIACTSHLWAHRCLVSLSLFFLFRVDRYHLQWPLTTQSKQTYTKCVCLSVRMHFVYSNMRACAMHFRIVVYGFFLPSFLFLPLTFKQIFALPHMEMAPYQCFHNSYKSSLTCI